jgi:hypothetical protein
LAAAVFVSFDDLALLDLLAGSRIMRAERDAGGCGALLYIRGGTIGSEPRYRSLRTLLPSTAIGKSSLSTSAGTGCHTWCKRMGFVRVVAGDK